MTFHAHYRCDGCEEILHVEDESQLYEAGWQVYSFGEDEAAYHFCSLPCVSRWANTELAQEAVKAAINHEEE